LDLRKNNRLTHLQCRKNKLISLDVKNNKLLLWLNCEDNQLSSAMLDAFFGTLYGNTIERAPKKRIIISGNPGADACKRILAENKGWSIN
jgi:hypothetical protein